MTRFGKIWPIWQKFKVFGNFLTFYFLFDKIMSIPWKIVGLIFIIANGQILKNNVTIWSHWLEQTNCTEMVRFPTTYLAGNK